LIVLDASAVLELLLATKAGRKVAERIGSPRLSLHVPHLLDLEVLQALRRYVTTGSLSSERARLALDNLGDLGLVRHEHDVLLLRIWSLRENLTAYDAAYVALAEGLKAPLLTLDKRLASAPGHRARIELVG
jgi:predicted nucleic acid-binding protein